MSNKLSNAMKQEMNERVKALPKDYQVVFYETSKYLYQFATTDADLTNIQTDILDMFETGTQNGKEVNDIVGDDVIGFCDGLLGTNPEHTWIGKMKSSMNQSIRKKLG